MITKLDRIGEKLDKNIIKNQISVGKKFILVNKTVNNNSKIPYNCILRRRHVIDGGKLTGTYPSRGYLRVRNILNNSNFQHNNWIFVKIIKNMSQIDNNIQMDDDTLNIFTNSVSKHELYFYSQDFDILILLDDDIYQNIEGNLYVFK